MKPHITWFGKKLPEDVRKDIEAEINRVQCECVWEITYTKKRPNGGGIRAVQGTVYIECKTTEKAKTYRVELDGSFPGDFALDVRKGLFS